MLSLICTLIDDAFDPWLVVGHLHVDAGQVRVRTLNPVGHRACQDPAPVLALHREGAAAVTLTRVLLSFFVSSAEELGLDVLDVARLQEPLLAVVVLDNWHCYFVQLRGDWPSVGQPPPARDEANHAREILVPLRHADGDNMLVEGHGSLHLEQSQVVVEGLSHVASVDDHSFHVALDGFLGLVVVREVELAQDDDERGEEPGLAVSRREDVFPVEQDAAALVLGEDPKPGGLLDQRLPRPLREVRSFAVHDPGFAGEGTHSTRGFIIPNPRGRRRFLSGGCSCGRSSRRRSRGRRGRGSRCGLG